MSNNQTLVKEHIGRSLGRLASGVYIVTCNNHGQSEGMLTTWIAQVAFEPPMISIAIKDGRPLLDCLQEGSQLAVNILSKANPEIFKQFAKPNLSSAERFAGLDLLPDSEFGPIFSKAVSYLLCTANKIIKAGDHNLVLAEVVGGAMLHESAEPMVHFRASGFQY
jgi:flavin reductase (DIM6/NTAB) family NADH-FMN oxidoreductase RutF